MEYKVNDMIQGFKVLKIREVKDLKGNLVEMIHEKSGAELVFLDRKEVNKTFCIGFKTTPENDTGVFHILEHSVLNGSKKYPVKEPFVDLLKSSLQTFLNAMTFPDKTIYPVSSRNPQDFLNLMDVYLDAVLHPAIYTNKNIFLQEGWHYEIRKEEDMPIYKGVVFNEMKGAFSSVDETLINAVNRTLFKDNCYKYVSGGDPRYIPDLTYEEFIETHKKYYHPSNSRIFIDGDLDLEVVLGRIDSFLKEYDAQEFNIEIARQDKVEGVEVVCKHPISEDEDPKDQTVIAFTFMLDDFKDVKRIAAWNILADVLAGSNDALLKKAILDKKLGQDVEIAVVDELLQPYVVVIVRNTNLECKDEIIATMNETIKQAIKDGLRKQQLVSILNQAEFGYREAKEPSGLIYAMSAYKSWLYDGDPMLYLSLGELFDELRNSIDDGYFEEVLRNDLLDDTYISRIIVLPDQKLQKEKELDEQNRLEAIKASWSKDEVSEMVKQNEVLDIWQAKEDTPEEKATLPILSLDEINKKPEDYHGELTKVHGVPTMVYKDEGRGIVYLNLYFNVAGITKDHLSSLSFFRELLGELPTSKHSLLELKEEVRTNIGQLYFTVDAYEDMNNPTHCIPALTVGCSVLEHNVDKAVELILEILNDTKFDKETILPYVKQANERGKQMMINSGSMLAISRVNAHLSCSAAVKDVTNGIGYITYLQNFDKHYDEMIEEFIFETSMYQDVIFSRSRCRASISSDAHIDSLNTLLDGLNNVEFKDAYVAYPKLVEQNEAYVIPSEISYSAKGFAMDDDSTTNLGHAKVLSQIMTYGYLWNEVRVKGGAYGTGLSAGANVAMTCMSYRDPTPYKSLDTFAKGASFIEELAKANMPLDSYIIGTIASSEPLRTPNGKMRGADQRWLRNMTYEDLCAYRTGILETSNEDLMKLAKMYDEGMKNATSCVIGPKSVFTDGIQAIDLFGSNSK